MKNEKVFDKEQKWRFCNGKLRPSPNEWSTTYKCDSCGNSSGMVNILGGCSTKIYY